MPEYLNQNEQNLKEILRDFEKAQIERTRFRLRNNHNFLVDEVEREYTNWTELEALEVEREINLKSLKWDELTTDQLVFKKNV